MSLVSANAQSCKAWKHTFTIALRGTRTATSLQASASGKGCVPTCC
jgi:hypothetical protein